LNSPAQAGTNTRYPYLVVRVFVAFYQRESISIFIGLPTVHIANRHCYVQHPTPFEADGTISPAGRALLIAGVQDAVRQLPFRMCIVWGPNSCTYVETDSIDESAHPPSGGSQQVALEFKAHHYSPSVLAADNQTPQGQ
jgi:hypothetical protein